MVSEKRNLSKFDGQSDVFFLFLKVDSKVNQTTIKIFLK